MLGVLGETWPTCLDLVGGRLTISTSCALYHVGPKDRLGRMKDPVCFEPLKDGVGEVTA